MSTLTVCVSYCSHERPFVRALLRQSLLISDQVVVAVGDRLFSGMPEDEPHVAALATEFPTVAFVRYDVGDHELSTPIVLHNRSRWTAASYRDQVGGWILFLDGDEVPDGKRFAAWWSRMRQTVDCDTAFKMANYWYFLHPYIRATPLEDSVLLVHRRHVSPMSLSHARERDGILSIASGGSLQHIKRLVVDDDGGDPMFHHFSWVRNRSALLAKVTSWGHCSDRTDWTEQVNNGLEQVASGEVPHDFVHGHPLTMISENDIPSGVTPDLDALCMANPVDNLATMS